MAQIQRRESAGFTLIETVIYLIVFGLVIGAVLIGRGIIRSAELKAIVSDVSQFKHAAKLFRDKYGYLPGDFPKAEEAWSSLAGCPETAASDLKTASTCNGNGNSFIGGTTSSAGTLNGTDQEVREGIRVWQHLSNAGFIEGAFTGTGNPATGGGLGHGLNIPRGPGPESGYTMHFAASYMDTFGAYRADYGHVIVFGCGTCAVPGMMGMGGESSYPGLNNPAMMPALSPEDALAIDKMVDDGKPGTGQVLSYTPNFITATRHCATSSSAATADYKVAHKNPACSLIFITGF
ncbi:MAG: prepilin-type N-terminal cleavage/methylation domain-containing protein [Planctomycetia bacterium]|nr:prepilin-type N-terminal cleavage/methylation domain-containing protein [Planctomycetia bacterium]